MAHSKARVKREAAMPGTTAANLEGSVPTPESQEKLNEKQKPNPQPDTFF